MSAIILICGIPASGKTTICRNLKNITGEEGILFSFDDYVRSSVQKDCGKNNGNLPKAKLLRQSWEKFVFDDIVKFENVKFVFIDDILYLQSQRRPFMKFASRNGFKFVVGKVESDVETAKKRNKSRQQFSGLEITDDVIQNIFEKFETENDFIFINSNSKIEDIWQNLNKKLESMPLEKRNLHNGDKISKNFKNEKDVIEAKSRKITNKIINSGFESRGKEINDLRRDYLKSAISGFDEELFEKFIIEKLSMAKSIEKSK